MAKYNDNKEFSDLIVRYREYGKNTDYNKIGKIIITIAKRFLNSPRFINYPEYVKMEMESEAIFHMLKYSLKRYSIDFDNPHAYFTQACKNAFFQIIKKYYLERENSIPINFLENIDVDSLENGTIDIVNENFNKGI